MILRAKNASDRYKDIVIYTPDTTLILLFLPFSKDIDSNLLVKTGVKNKARIIFIERIIDILVKCFSQKKYQFCYRCFSWITCFYRMRQRECILEKRKSKASEVTSHK